MGEVREIVRYAVDSRILVIVLQFLFNYFIPDHEPDAFKSPLVALESQRWSTADRVVHKMFEGLNRWDSQYFTHIAQFGYTYEHMVAFFPFYPWLSAVGAQFFQDTFGSILSPSSWILISCVLLSNICFIWSAITLYYLTRLLFSDRTLPLEVAKLFCFNPASIFFSSCYTESLFSFVTFAGLYFLERDFDTLSTFMFAISSITRSNATLVPIFYLYKIVRRFRKNKYYFGLIMRMGMACIGNIAVQLYFWEKFCFPHQLPKLPQEVESYATKMNYKTVGEAASKWCFHFIPLSYSYVQSKYWNVGIFRYWQTKQLPNFVLALPVIVLTVQFCRRNYHRFPSYCVHSIVLGCIFIFMANVQVATRVIMSASPVPFWAAAQLSKKSNLVWAYFLWYFVVGIFLHSNFLPWT